MSVRQTPGFKNSPSQTHRWRLHMDFPPPSPRLPKRVKRKWRARFRGRTPITWKRCSMWRTSAAEILVKVIHPWVDSCNALYSHTITMERLKPQFKHNGFPLPTNAITLYMYFYCLFVCVFHFLLSELWSCIWPILIFLLHICQLHLLKVCGETSHCTWSLSHVLIMII